jgi:hypothetical protein
MEEERKVYRVLVGEPEGKRHLEDQGVDGNILPEWILERFAKGVWNRCSWLRIVAGGRLL